MEKTPKELLAEILDEFNKKSEDEKEVELVNHPAHYNWIPYIECLDVAEHFNFNLGNAIKYIWREPCKARKEDMIIDLRKAIFYLEREIDLLERD